MKTEAQLQAERVATVQRHCQELRDLYMDGKISEDDHDRIGLIMASIIHHLLAMNDTAWETFKRMIEEIRQWRKENREWLS